MYGQRLKTFLECFWLGKYGIVRNITSALVPGKKNKKKEDIRIR